MSNNNSNRGKQGKKSNAAQARKQLKNEILNEIRAAAGQPAKGKGRGKRNRQAKRQADGLAGDGEMSAAPVAMGKTTKTSAPRMVTMRNGDAHVVHREYIQDVTAESTTPSLFKVTTLAVNPGLASMFPWLSKVAANYESYRFRGLRICYETEAPSSLGGTLVLAVDYDAADVAPVSKQQALAYRASVRSPPWKPCCHTSQVEDLSKQKTYFIRTGAVPAGADVHEYDTGNLQVITQGVTTGSAVCGELYVEYDVLLMTPVFDPSSISGALVAGGGSIAAATPFGAVPVSTGQLTMSGAATNLLTIAGLLVGTEYLLSTWLSGTVMSVANWNITAGGTLVTTLATSAQSANTNEHTAITFTATATTATVTLSVTATTVTASRTVCAALVPAPSF